MSLTLISRKHTGILSAGEHRSLAKLILILAVALFLRLYRLDYGGFWLDEIGQLTAAGNLGSNYFAGIASHQGAAPLDYFVTSLVLQLTENEIVLRLPAVIWGIFAIFLVYLIGSKFIDARTGLLSAALLAISPFHIRYSQELRFYSLFILLCLLSTYSLCQLLGRPKRQKWWLYFGLLFLTAYAHYLAAILFLFHGFLVLQSARFREPEGITDYRPLVNWLAATLLAGTAFLPWVIFDLGNFGVSSGTFSGETPPLNQVIAHVFAMQTATYTLYFAVDPFIVWGGVALFLLGFWRSVTQQRSPLVLGSAFLLGVAVIFVTSLDRLASYFYHPRQLIFVFPFILFGISTGFFSLVDMLPRRLWRYIATASFLLLIAVRAWNPLTDYYHWVQEPWRAIAEFVSKDQARNKKILVPRVAMFLDFYLPGEEVRTYQADTLSEAPPALNQEVGYFVLITNYVPGYPQEVGLKNEIESGPHLLLRFSDTFHLYYASKGVTAKELMIDALTFELDPQLISSSNLVELARDADLNDTAVSIISDAIEEVERLGDSELKRELSFGLGRLYFYEGLVEEAIKEFEKLVEAEPENTSFQTWLGRSYLIVGQPEKAIQVLERAVLIDNQSFWSHVFLGRAYLITGRNENASEHYRFALEQNPTNFEVQLFLGQAVCRHGDVNEAVAIWENAIGQTAGSGISDQALSWRNQVLQDGTCP